MDIPPPALPIAPLTGSDKRVTVQLRKYWDFLKEERAFPAESEINQRELANIWANCFIVKADNSCKTEDYEYKYLGENIVKAYGADITGLKINSLAAPEAPHLAEKYENVLALKRPVLDEGEITLSKTSVIKYRQILLPLGDDGININAILGGMSYKIDQKEKKSFFFGIK